jgi:signal peptidase I
MMAEPGMAPGENRQRVLMWTIVPLTAILVATVILLYVLYTTALVDGESMFPSLENGDYLLVEQGYDRPLRGDVIVYEGRDLDGSPVQVVKRVIAVPGDTIEVISGTAIVNGAEEVCDYCVTIAEGDTSTSPLIVPDEHVFTMGDNRPISLDSRHYGPVPLERVVGEAQLVVAPFSRFGLIDEPFLTE